MSAHSDAGINNASEVWPHRLGSKSTGSKRKFIGRHLLLGVLIGFGPTGCQSETVEQAALEGLLSPLEALLGQRVNADSLEGKNIVGYQGWFSCPPFDGGWGHWSLGPPSANTLTVDFWPDTSELGQDELCATGWQDSRGNPVYTFSSSNGETVARHFRWMREYGIDGVSAQRFVSLTSTPSGTAQLDRVLSNVRDGAERNGRVFFVEYDISGADPRTWKDQVLADWRRINQQMNITQSPSYLKHRGRPLIGVWGLGFLDRPGTPREAEQLLAALKAGGEGAPSATVLGGVPSYWRTLSADSKADPGWLSVYRGFDVLNPWMVGRFLDRSGADHFYANVVVPDLEDTRRHNIDYLPVLFPGFSDGNLQTVLGTPRAQNLAPRDCGKFYQHQVDLALENRVNMLYTAMFDEVDEGTAIMKVMPTQSRLPAGVPLVSLDAEGCALASDYYLRLTGQAARALRSQ